MRCACSGGVPLGQGLGGRHGTCLVEGDGGRLFGKPGAGVVRSFGADERALGGWRHTSGD